MSNLNKWIEGVLIVAEANGMPDSEVIPTWPRDVVEANPGLYPDLTVGDVRQWQAARSVGDGEAVAWDDPAVDPVVSKLYRKFKEWSQRGFTADDVTWCEVRGYVAELISAHSPAAKVPEGWLVRRVDDRITVQHPDIGGYCASKESDDQSAIAPVILYHLAESLLSATPQPEAGAGQWVPELNDEVAWILGRPNFACAPLAQTLRSFGHEIAHKAESEQAAAIHWMLTLYAKHGPDWRSEAEKILKPQPPQEGE